MPPRNFNSACWPVSIPESTVGVAVDPAARSILGLLMLFTESHFFGTHLTEQAGRTHD